MITPPKKAFTFCAVCLEHVNETRVLDLHNSLHVFGDELPFHHLDDGLLSGFVQAVKGPPDLFVYSGLHLIDVDAGTVLCQEQLALNLQRAKTLYFLNYI